MIDVSKYEKVGEFKDGRLHWLEGRDINAVYLIKFKEDFYIGSAEYLYIRIKEHTKSFVCGIHTKKMQTVFDNEPSFEVYVIEKGICSENLVTEENKYIKKLAPTLNVINADDDKKSDIRIIIETRLSELGMSKKDLAEKSGLPQGSLNARLDSPTWPTLKKIANAMGLSVADLVGNTKTSASSAITCPYCGKELRLAKVEETKTTDEQ